MTIKDLITGKKQEDYESPEAQVNLMKEGQAFEAAIVEDREFKNLQESRNDLVRWQQDLPEELERLMHELRNEILVDGEWQPKMRFVGYNDQGEATYEAIPPMMNETGIAMTITALRPLISRNLINSNYSEDWILQRLRGTINGFVLDFRNNFYHYQIRKENLQQILSLIKNVIEPTFWRAWNNGERKYLTTIHKHIEATNQTTKPQNKNSVFGGFT